MLQLSLVIRRDHTILGTPIVLMVGRHSADQAIRVDMLASPTLVTLLFKGAAGLNEVVFAAIFTRAFKLVQRGRRGVSPGSGAPAIVRGALGGDKGNS